MRTAKTLPENQNVFIINSNFKFKFKFHRKTHGVPHTVHHGVPHSVRRPPLGLVLFAWLGVAFPLGGGRGFRRMWLLRPAGASVYVDGPGAATDVSVRLRGHFGSLAAYRAQQSALGALLCCSPSCSAQRGRWCLLKRRVYWGCVLSTAFVQAFLPEAKPQ